jgi:cyclic-di-GMP-binding biofilm dispersal mediator protein
VTELNGAQVLVVGATGGLGSAIARQLVRAGATLTISGRRGDTLQALADELGDAVHTNVAADLTLPGSPRQIIERATADGRTLDGVVYAAGVVAFGPLSELDDDILDELLLANFVAPVRLAQAVLPSLRKGAFVVNLSAIVAESPTAGMAAYSATKAALTAFDTAIRVELRRSGIRVVDARPPHTETGLAGRPISGTAPRLPAGLAPDAVAERIVRAILDDERDLGPGAFATARDRGADE